MLGEPSLREVLDALMTTRSFDISVATWSFHRLIRSGELTMLDAPRLVREDLGLGALELVNVLLDVPTFRYVERLSAAAASHDVAIPLLMCDGERRMGAADSDERELAVRDHTRWIWIAADLGCRAVRINWHGFDGELDDTAAIDELIERSAATFDELAEIADRHDIDVLIENHGGPSSDPGLVCRLMERIDSPRLGTLPDFGNFPPEIDKYAAIDELMPWARALSAKCYDFDDTTGRETTIDFEQMLTICVDKHGYDGVIGIEYEGERLDERRGTEACRDLLVRLRDGAA